MEHNAVVLSASEYKRLVIIEERCAIIEGLLRKNEFISIGDLQVILDIQDEETRAKLDFGFKSGKDGADNG